MSYGRERWVEQYERAVDEYTGGGGQGQFIDAMEALDLDMSEIKKLIKQWKPEGEAS